MYKFLINFNFFDFFNKTTKYEKKIFYLIFFFFPYIFFRIKQNHNVCTEKNGQILKKLTNI